MLCFMLPWRLVKTFNLVLMFVFIYGAISLRNCYTSRSVVGWRQGELRLLSLDSISHEDRPISLDTSSCYELHLLESSDLYEAAELALECFYKSKLVLNSEGSSAAESATLERVLTFFRRLEVLDNFLSNYIGFWNRGGSRLGKPSLHRNKYALILAATERKSENDSNILPPAWASTNHTVPSAMMARPGDTELQKYWQPRLSAEQRLVGLVEISIERADGKLSPPLHGLFRRIPEQDDRGSNRRGLGRRMGFITEPDVFKPYLCNLCVAHSQRRRGLGQYLCRVAEDIARTQWGGDSMYLHVEQSNEAAQRLYSGLGYEPIEGVLSEQESKLLNMDDIFYYRKTLL